jgi:hypothetical protein
MYKGNSVHHNPGFDSAPSAWDRPCPVRALLSSLVLAPPYPNLALRLIVIFSRPSRDLIVVPRPFRAIILVSRPLFAVILVSCQLLIVLTSQTILRRRL